MADTATVEQVNSTEAVDTQENRTFTQEELDEIVKARIAKERAKYTDYDDLKAKASKFDEIEEANKTELEKATEKAAALQKQIDEMTKAEEIRAVRDKVSKETGVPAHLLTADTEDECTAQAKGILSFARPTGDYPTVKDGGEVQKIQHKNETEQFEEWFKASINN